MGRLGFFVAVGRLVEKSGFFVVVGALVERLGSCVVVAMWGVCAGGLGICRGARGIPALTPSPWAGG